MSLSVPSQLTKSPCSIEIWRGQSKDVKVTVTYYVEENSSMVLRRYPLTSCTMYCSVKRVSDQTEVLAKTSATATDIEILDQAENKTTVGQAVIHWNSDDTQFLEADSYIFDVWVKTSTNKRYIVIEPAEYIIKEPVTRIK